MWFSNKKLFEREPKELDLELLSVLQTSLMAKLILVNEELMRRFNALGDVDLKGVDEQKELLSNTAQELKGFNMILKQLLTSYVGKGKKPTA